MVFDSGYKYIYDKYNDVYRYVPCNGDIAGLCLQTTEVSEPWFSPAGFQRGVIRNAIKLAYTPNKTQRDRLYSAVNPMYHSSQGRITVMTAQDLHPHSIESCKTSIPNNERVIWVAKHNSSSRMMNTKRFFNIVEPYPVTQGRRELQT